MGETSKGASKREPLPPGDSPFAVKYIIIIVIVIKQPETQELTVIQH
jgi:hypothetical protein